MGSNCAKADHRWLINVFSLSRLTIYLSINFAINDKEVPIGPMEVTVGLVVIDVKIIPNQANEDSAKLNVQISYDYALIIVEKHLNLQAQALDLTHEAVHAILTQAGYEDHDEKTVGNLPRNQHKKTAFLSRLLY
jgi:Zn-dependent peptidase ImmA (M78 family)